MDASPARLDVEAAAAGGAATSVPQPATQEGEDAASEAEWSRRHAVNIRLSIPFFFGRFYVTLVAGKERRSPGRLVRERRKHPLATLGNMAFLFALGTVGGLAILALMQFLSALLLQEFGMVVMPS